MPKAKQGDTVKVNYSGKLDDGTIFDSTVRTEPLEFTLGSGKIMPSFEQAIIEMSPGETKKVEIPAENGFGPYLEELVYIIDSAKVPPELNLEIGKRLKINSEDEQPINVTVTDISENKITLDANHPLAGEKLFFEIELVEIV